MKELFENIWNMPADQNHDWRAIFDLALRGGTYQRHGDNKWVLIESNQGFG